MTSDSEPQREEWTPARGLRRGVLHELVWGAVCAAVTAAVLAVATPSLNEIPEVIKQIGIFGLQSGIVVLMIAIGLSLPAIWLMWKRLQVTAGFAGALLGALAVISIAAAAGVGALLASRLGTLDGGMAIACAVTISAICFAWIAYDVSTG